jgi:tetratricopeptide (TPR) repeat protein
MKKSRVFVPSVLILMLLILGIGLLLEKDLLESLAEEKESLPEGWQAGKGGISGKVREFARAEDAEFIANLYLANRKYEDALLVYNQILNTDPQNPRLTNIRFNIANIYNIQHKLNNAIVVYEEIIRSSKEQHPQAVTEYKRYEEEMKPYQEAMRRYAKEMREFRRAGGTKPEQPVRPVIENPRFLPPQTLEMNIMRAFLSIANIYKTNDKEEDAEAVFKNMAGEGITEEFTWIALFSLAGLYESGGKYDEALKTYQQLLDLNFQRGSIYYPVLTAPALAGGADAIFGHITSPPVLSSRPATILGLMANVYERQGRFDKAIETYRRIIEDKSSQDADISTAWLFMGNLQQRTGNIKEAIKSFEAVVAMGQEIPQTGGTRPLRRQISEPYAMQLDRLVNVAKTKLETLRNLETNEAK